MSIKKMPLVVGVYVSDVSAEWTRLKYVYGNGDDEPFEVRYATLEPMDFDVSNNEALGAWALEQSVTPLNKGADSIYRNVSENSAVLVRHYEPRTP